MIRRIQDDMNNPASPGLVTEDCLSPKDFSLFRGRSWWGSFKVLKFWCFEWHFIIFENLFRWDNRGLGAHLGLWILPRERPVLYFFVIKCFPSLSFFCWQLGITCIGSIAGGLSRMLPEMIQNRVKPSLKAGRRILKAWQKNKWPNLSNFNEKETPKRVSKADPSL